MKSKERIVGISGFIPNIPLYFRPNFLRSQSWHKSLFAVNMGATWQWIWEYLLYNL
jgi:hypothetical protein